MGLLAFLEGVGDGQRTSKSSSSWFLKEPHMKAMNLFFFVGFLVFNLSFLRFSCFQNFLGACSICCTSILGISFNCVFETFEKTKGKKYSQEKRLIRMV
ncbi:hypothetical protein Hanom_Chr02g00106371 [Helianthus anomalus]